MADKKSSIILEYLGLTDELLINFDKNMDYVLIVRLFYKLNF
jgi:hypothetical protein